MAQIERQITDRRTEKETLERDLALLKPQHLQAQTAQTQTGQTQAQPPAKNQAQAELSRLEQQLGQQRNELKRVETQISDRRQNLKQLDTQLEARRREKSQIDRDLETQKATQKAQQPKVSALQDDLKRLENQISDRRQEKEAIERQITQLQAQKTALRNQSLEVKELRSEGVVPNGRSSAQEKGEGVKRTEKGVRETGRQDFPPHVSASASAGGSQPEQVQEENLTDGWQDFMVQLADYEFEALKAIAHEPSPMRVLNQIAENNFTTAGELIDSINQRAQDTLGERVIKPQSGFAPPSVFRDQARAIQKLIDTYEYLTR
jgi:predicted  nucleic acid-binding Zn-ribbon protein